MPLKKGKNSIRANVAELMNPVQSSSRRKAIATIARKNNITLQEAQFRQALAISRRQAKRR